jgi:hypothetical protein
MSRMEERGRGDTLQSAGGVLFDLMLGLIGAGEVVFVFKVVPVGHVFGRMGVVVEDKVFSLIRRGGR